MIRPKMKKWWWNTSLILGLRLLFFLALESPGASREDEVIAVLNGQPIYLSQIEENAAFQVYRLQSNIYSVLKHETEEIVTRQLLEAEAARQGLTVEGLLKKEIDAKVSPPGEKEVDEYIIQHPAEGLKGEEKKARIRTYLYGRALAQRKLDFVASLREKADYRFLMKPPDRPRIKLQIEGEPWRGNPDAPITLVHFADFTSRVSALSAEKIRRIMDAFPGRIKWVHRNFFSIQDSNALLAAEMGEAAQEQEKFWRYHDRMFGQMGNMEREDILRIAGDVGIDLKKFEERQKKGVYLLKVKEDIGYGVRIGMQAAPVIFVNGIYLSGTFPYEEVRTLAQKEMGRAESLKKEAK